MRKLSGTNFNYTYRLHLVLVIRNYFDKNLIYPKVQAARILIKKKSSSQVLNLLNMLKTKIISNTARNIQILVKSFFFLHNFKLKTEATDWVKQIWSYRTTTLAQRDFIISCGWISLSKTNACSEGHVFV